jgi:RNA polymerase sigma-70 factor, ECF subfamily
VTQDEPREAGGRGNHQWINDADTVEQFIERGHLTLLRFARGVARGNGHQAEDAVQETWARFYPCFHFIERDYRMAWCYTTTRRQLYRQWRKEVSGRARDTRYQQLHPSTPANHADTTCDKAEVEWILQQLTPRQAAALILHYEGLTDEEIARILGVRKANTVASTRRHALEKARRITKNPGLMPPATAPNDQIRTTRVVISKTEGSPLTKPRPGPDAGVP